MSVGVGGVEWQPAAVLAATPYTADVNDQRIVEFPELKLESGKAIAPVQAAFKTWGTLNETRDNVVVVCHAFSGSCDAQDWWSQLYGSGRVLDPARFFIVCVNLLGSPYGSSSPVTINAATGKPYGPDFPCTTVRDSVQLQMMVVFDYLAVASVRCVIGGSLGGMVALEWAIMAGDRVKSVVPIATSARHSAWCIGFSEVQRQCIYGDPLYQGGRYSLDNPPTHGLATARMAAMLTYRSRTSFESRFGRKIQNKPASQQGGLPNPASEVFSAQSYLRYQGDKFIRRFDVNCYLHILNILDSQDVGRGRPGGLAGALASIRQPALVIGVESDVLYVLEEQEEIAAHIPGAQLRVITSTDGHDGFLLEFAQLNKAVRAWMRETMPGGDDGVDDAHDFDQAGHRSKAGEGWGDWDEIERREELKMQQETK